VKTLNPLAPALYGAELRILPNHRFFLQLILSLFNNGDCPQSSNGSHIREKADFLLLA